MTHKEYLKLLREVQKAAKILGDPKSTMTPEFMLCQADLFQRAASVVGEIANGIFQNLAYSEVPESIKKAYNLSVEYGQSYGHSLLHKTAKYK